VVGTVALDSLPETVGPVSVAGDAAVAVASRLAARGEDVLLLPDRFPTSTGIAIAAQRRMTSGLAGRLAQPLYVDPPEARPGGRA
jgi:tRNA threonylcarbamoyladenosine biosynthesis protein TsaB